MTDESDEFDFRDFRRAVSGVEVSDNVVYHCLEQWEMRLSEHFYIKHFQGQSWCALETQIAAHVSILASEMSTEQFGEVTCSRLPKACASLMRHGFAFERRQNAQVRLAGVHNSHDDHKELLSRLSSKATDFYNGTPGGNGGRLLSYVERTSADAFRERQNQRKKQAFCFVPDIDVFRGRHGERFDTGMLLDLDLNRPMNYSLQVIKEVLSFACVSLEASAFAFTKRVENNIQLGIEGLCDDRGWPEAAGLELHVWIRLVLSNESEGRSLFKALKPVSSSIALAQTLKDLREVRNRPSHAREDPLNPVTAEHLAKLVDQAGSLAFSLSSPSLQSKFESIALAIRKHARHLQDFQEPVVREYESFVEALRSVQVRSSRLLPVQQALEKEFVARFMEQRKRASQGLRRDLEWLKTSTGASNLSPFPSGTNAKGLLPAAPIGNKSLPPVPSPSSDKTMWPEVPPFPGYAVLDKGTKAGISEALDTPRHRPQSLQAANSDTNSPPAKRQKLSTR